MRTHLYAGAKGTLYQPSMAITKCGLQKAFVADQVPMDVVAEVGRVTCPDCIRLHKGMPNKDFSAQQGKKAQ